MRNILLESAASALVAGALTWAVPANAQEAAETAPPQQSPPSDAAEKARPGAGSFDEDIIVTARKRDERLSDAPLAINAFGRSFIEKYQVQSVQDVAAFTPGLVVGESNSVGGNQVYLRGVGSALESALADGAVSVVLDGVQVSGHAMRAAQFDLGQIEVLRGPQALFFGKNSPGGVISLTSAAPTDELSIGVTAGYEFVAREKYVEGFVSGPLSNTLKARIAARYSNSDGWWKFRSLALPGVSLGTDRERGSGQDFVTVRSSLEFEPSSIFDARATFAYMRLRQNTQVIAQRSYCPLGFAQQVDPAFVPIEDCTVNNTVVIGENFPAPLAADPLTLNRPLGYVNNDLYFGSLTSNLHLSDALTLTSVTGYYDAAEGIYSNFSTEPAPLIASTNRSHLKQFSEELRLASNWEGPVNFLIGGFYEDSSINYRQGLISSDGNTVTGLGPDGGPLVERADQSRKVWSAFGQLILKPALAFEIDLGGRYSDERKRVGYQSSVFPGVVEPVGGSWNNFSPEATVRYRPNDQLNLYGSYKKAFKSGGIDAAAGQPTGYIVGVLTNTPLDTTYDEERAEGFEIGAKLASADGRLRVNLAAFTYKYKGLQLSSLDTARVAIRIDNVAGARTKGIEADVSWRPAGATGLSIFGNAAYLDAYYTDFISDCYGGQSISQGCNLSPGPTGLFQQQDLTGRRLKGAPEFSSTLGVAYDTSLSDTMNISFSVDGTYTSEYVTDIADAPHTQQDGFAKLNAAIRLSTAGDRWQLALIGRNLTNKYVITQSNKDFVSGGVAVQGGPTPSPVDYFANVLRGREVQLQVSFRY